MYRRGSASKLYHSTSEKGEDILSSTRRMYGNLNNAIRFVDKERDDEIIRKCLEPIIASVIDLLPWLMDRNMPLTG